MADAIEAAADEAMRHLTQLRQEVGATGQPCRYCRHGDVGLYSWNRECRNPLVRRGSHDIVTGEVAWRDRDQREVRGGLCGQEGRLFEPVPPLLRAYRWARWRQWPIFAAIMMGAPGVFFLLLLLLVGGSHR